MQTANAPVEPSNSKQLDSHHHIAELDGIRGLAILMVTLYRFSKDLPDSDWFCWWLSHSFRAGTRGVELFFVLSGFLITGILLQSRGQAHYFRNFIARRALRIFPLYFASLFLFLTVLPLVTQTATLFQPAVERQFFLWTYLANVVMVIENSWCLGPMDHFWSLAVEEHFYLVWPFVIALMPISGAAGRFFWAAMLVGLARVVFCALSQNELAPSVLTVFRCDGLLLGAALACAFRSPEGLAKLRPWAVKGLLILGPILVAMGIDGRRFASIGETLWPMFWSLSMIVVLTSSKESRLTQALRMRGLLRLGKISYGMYVFQNPLLGIAGVYGLAAYLDGWVGAGFVSQLLFMAVLFVATYLSAVLSWHLLEKHCLKLKDYFTVREADREVSHVPGLASNRSPQVG